MTIKSKGFLLMILSVLLVFLSACSQREKIEMPGKEQFTSKEEERTSQNEENESDGDNKDITEDSQGQETGEQGDNHNENDSIDSESSDILDNETDGANDNGTSGEVSGVEISEDNFSDLINEENFDPDNYVTDLVFIKQEGDLWRVVDNQGNVFRVSTSYEGLEQGIISHDATVATDENGDKRLSLTRNYTYNDNLIVREGDVEDLVSVFVNDLLLRYTNTSNELLKLNDYEIISTEVKRSVGKGAKVISFTIRANPFLETSEWSENHSLNNGWTEEITSSIVIFGYENTWILPRYNHPFGRGLVDLDISESNNTSNMDEDFIIEDGMQLFENESLVLFSNKEMIDDTSQEYLTQLIIKNKSNGDAVQIFDGLKNGEFLVQTVRDSYVYLLATAWIPESESYPESYYLVNLETGKVTELIDTGVIDGAVLDDVAYVFTNKYLYEVELAKGDKSVVCRLPVDIQLSYDSIVITSVTETTLTIQFTTLDGDFVYSVNRESGILTEIN